MGSDSIRILLTELCECLVDTCFPSIFVNTIDFLQVIESRDRSQDDPAGPISAMRVSVLVSAHLFFSGERGYTRNLLY